LAESAENMFLAINKHN